MFICLFISCPVADSLLLGLQFVVVVGSVPNEWPESSVDVAIDPWKGSDDFVQPVTLSAPEEENDAKPVTVHADEGGASDRAASAVATPTGRGKLSERAAEILGTSGNRQQAAISSSSVLPNTPETVSTQSTHLSTQETTMSSSASLMPVSESTTVTSTTTEMMTISSTSIQLPSEPSDETIQPDETNTTSMAIVSTSTISSLNESTAQSNPNGNEEYFADDAASSSSTTDAIVDEDETTVVTDKSTIVHHFDLDSSVQHWNTSPALVVEETTSTTTTEMSRPSLAVSSVVAVGRALSQEESVPWPEAKSTKVIGTIIEDIHGPFSDGVSSVSTSSPDVLTSSGIAAIVMCTFLVLLTTAGE